MRIDELRLRAFGPFTDRSLRFEDSPDFHLLFGPNEAGKSTTLRAVTGLLYGIPANTPDAHRHAMPRLRIGARIVDSSGRALELTRRKGLKNTLLDASGLPLEDDALASFLQGAEESSFRALFALSHDELRRGGADLLAGRGDLGLSLFGASLGGNRLQKVLSRLHRAADALFSSRATKKPVNRALREHGEARQRLAEAALPSSEWTEAQEALRKSEAELSAVSARLAAARTRRAERARAIELLPILARRRQLLEEIAALGQGRELADEDFRSRDRLARMADEARGLERRALEDIGQLQAKRDRLAGGAAFVDEAVRFEELRNQLGSQLKAEKDMPRVWGETKQREDDLEELLQNLGHPGGLEAAEELRLDAALEARIRGMIQKRAALAERARQCEALRTEAESALRADERELAALGPAESLETLAAARREARDAGALDREIARLESAISAGEEQAGSIIAALPGFAGDGAALAALDRLPGPEAIAEERARRRRSRERSDALEAETQRLEGEKARRGTELAALSSEGPLPRPAELDELRSQRDAGLSQFLEDPSSAAAERLRALMSAADLLADRLYAKADVVRRREDGEAALKRLESELEAASRQRRDLIAEENGAAARWRAAWAPVEPGSPEAMERWLAQRDRAIAVLAELAARREELERRRAEREGLLALLSAAGAEAPHLAAALERADEVYEARLATRERRRGLEEDLREGRRLIERRRAEERQVLEELESWGEGWRAALKDGALPLKAEAGPDEAIAVIDALRDLQSKQDARMRLLRRYKGMKRDRRAFEAFVRDLAGELMPELVDRDGLQAAEELLRQYQVAREDHRLREETERRISERRRALSEAREALREAERGLADLEIRAGLQGREEWEEAERRHRRRGALVVELSAEEERLLQLGRGATIGELAAELEALRGRDLSSEVAELDGQIRAEEERRSELERAVGQGREKAAGFDLSSAAAQAAAEAQDALARARGGIERFALLRLSERLLRAEIERYRDEHQGPLVRRAGELFARLTLSAFSGLKAGFDKRDEAVLLCERSGGGEVGVEGLSEGTRDQLYLALRLACIEGALERQEPMPLICDDLLVHFDDARAAACLEILAELATRTQVLLFTHHGHLVELAREALGADRFRSQRLERSIEVS